MTYIYRVHAVQRMFERDILEQDVEDTIENGKIIVITAYYPDKEKWDENFKKRRRET